MVGGSHLSTANERGEREKDVMTILCRYHSPGKNEATLSEKKVGKSKVVFPEKTSEGPSQKRGSHITPKTQKDDGSLIVRKGINHR